MNPLEALPQAVRDALARGDKIGAIKAMRTMRHLDLKAAKLAIEAAQQGRAAPASELAPGEEPNHDRLWHKVVEVLLLVVGALALWRWLAG